MEPNYSLLSYLGFLFGFDSFCSKRECENGQDKRVTLTSSQETRTALEACGLAGSRIIRKSYSTEH